MTETTNIQINDLTLKDIEMILFSLSDTNEKRIDDCYGSMTPHEVILRNIIKQLMFSQPSQHISLSLSPQYISLILLCLTTEESRPLREHIIDSVIKT